MRPGPNTDAQSGSPLPWPTTWRDATRSGPWASERLVWTAAALVGVLDILLTLYGLDLGFTETNPVAAAAVVVVGPVPGLVGLKLFALCVAAAGSRVVPAAVRPSFAALLAVTWTGASAYNCWLLAAVA